MATIKRRNQALVATGRRVTPANLMAAAMVKAAGLLKEGTAKPHVSANLMAAAMVKAAGLLKEGTAKPHVSVNLMAVAMVKAAGHLKEGIAKPPASANLMAAAMVKAAGHLKEGTAKLGSRDGESRRPFERRDGEAVRRGGSFDRQDRESYADKRKGEDDPREHRPARRNRFDEKPQVPGRVREPKDQIRLNKYLADAGICSRREADLLIQAGTVTVNGEVVTTLGTKVGINDKVNYGGQTLKREKLRYVLLNKPKGYITTSDDPYDRKTVMELVQHACEERIYPVGRLDRNTLGLLLLTNDGDLAKRLMHPRHGVKKLYHVELDKPLTRHDMLQIAEGLELEDGKAEVDAISYVSKDESKKEIGIEIHSGKNRIVRRIFEHLGYKVEKLDRVMLAGLTKLDLPRGKYRHLTPPEVSLLMRIK